MKTLKNKQCPRGSFATAPSRGIYLADTKVYYYYYVLPMCVLYNIIYIQQSVGGETRDVEVNIYIYTKLKNSTDTNRRRYD